MSPRKYDNSRRDEGARQTRERIFDAVLALLVERGPLTVPAIAQRAGVAVPTVYRHFPTREALMDASIEAIGERVRRPDIPATPEAYLDRVGARVAWYEEHPDLARAILVAEANAPYREAMQRRREQRLVEVFASRLGHLPPERGRAIAALINWIGFASTWSMLRDDWRLSADDAAWAVEWATRTVLDAISEEKP